MTVQVVTAQDAISVNESTIPADVLACGYDTGGGIIQWTSAQFAARTKPYPAIHIDQDPSASDGTADVLDVESGAATVADIPGWVTRARANWLAVARPGQRHPVVYCSMNTLDAAVAALTAAKLTDVGFWTAEPGNTLSYATGRITAATGPYPCIGVQYAWGNTVDDDAFNLAWIQTGSTKPVPVPSIQTGTVKNSEGKIAQVYSNDGGITWYYAPLKSYAGDVLVQSGTVHSDTTGGNANVATTDGGLTWKYVA